MLPFYTALGLLPKGHVDMRVVCSAPITALRTKHLPGAANPNLCTSPGRCRVSTVQERVWTDVNWTVCTWWFHAATQRRVGLANLIVIVAGTGWCSGRLTELSCEECSGHRTCGHARC